MSRTVTSPSTRWPGSVTLSDPLTYPQLIVWYKAVSEASKTSQDGSPVESDYAILRGVYTVVEKWDLQNWTATSPDNFPATPRKYVIEMVSWLIDSINALVDEAEALPPQ